VRRWTRQADIDDGVKDGLTTAEQADDARASVAIYSHPGPPGGNRALQIRGIAELMSDESDPGGRLQYRVTPTEVWCFDSRVFGPHRRQVDLSRLPLTDATRR
jgi:hypothetical protein